MKRRYKVLNALLAVSRHRYNGPGFITVELYRSIAKPAAIDTGASDTMKAVISRCYGGPDALEYVDVEKAAACGQRNCGQGCRGGCKPSRLPLYARHTVSDAVVSRYWQAPSDQRMGVDFAGVVADIGADVSLFDVGDEVFGGRSGAFAEFIVVPEDRGLAKIPEGVSFEDAAAIPIAAITALQALRDDGRLQAGEKVLINGASGGVGTYAVQIAKALGADVHGVCSTRNVAMVKALGADHVFDYKKENYTDSDNEYDLIVDMVGSHGLNANRDVLKPGGRMVLVGGPKGNWIAPFWPPLKAMMLSPFVDEEIGMMLAEINGEDLTFLADLMADERLTSRIDRRYPLHETAEALRYLETRRARGKVIISME